jgi:hypothetical protein
MLFCRIVRVGAIVAALAVAGWLLAQSQPPSKQYVVLLKRGPKWVAGKPASEQTLGNHAHGVPVYDAPPRGIRAPSPQPAQRFSPRGR